MKGLLKVSFILIPVLVYAQYRGAFTEFSLSDMSSFRPQAGNWRIVGDVLMNSEVDVHVPVEQLKSVSKKAVSYKPGKGILLNLNDADMNDMLITTWEHGDLELELEVMLPKGSNSGVYLQGRYEVQLYDSWGIVKPKYSDMGGIYRNWINYKPTSYAGQAPLTNAAKEPGVWQQLKISFRSPRFNKNAEKIMNARFVYVKLNGVIIHRNVEPTNHTGGPVEKNEVALGPLMIQGDHGPVAFRDIRYKHLKE